MITLSLLLITMGILLIVTFFSVLAGGLAFIVAFGDVIVAILIVVWIVKRIFFHKKQD